MFKSLFKRATAFAAALALAMACAGPALAQGPVMGGDAATPGQVKARPDTKTPKPTGPVNMSTGTVFKPGKAALSLKMITFDKEDLYDGGDKKDGTYNGKYDRAQRTVQACVRYGLFENFDMRFMVPYHERSVSRRSGAGTPLEKTYEDDNDGIGDAVLMGRYALWSQRDGAPLSVAIGAGVKMPTGDSKKINRRPFGIKKKYMGPGFQAGTGSWDPKFELGATKMFGRSRVDFHTMYTLGTTGTEGMRKGNQLKYGLGYAYALSSLFDAGLEYNGVYMGENRNEYDTVENTGGHTMYLTPSLRFKCTPKFNVSLGVPYVVYRDLNSQPDANQYAIGENYRVILRLAWKLN